MKVKWKFVETLKREVAETEIKKEFDLLKCVKWTARLCFQLKKGQHLG